MRMDWRSYLAGLITGLAGAGSALAFLAGLGLYVARELAESEARMSDESAEYLRREDRSPWRC